MDTLSYKTLTPNAESVQKEWVIVDATDQVLGRLCSKVAKILRGKNKPSYSPNVECGVNVIVSTGYPGGQREQTPEVLMKKSYNKHLKPGMNPLFLRVMKGMLPKNRLGRQLIKNVHIYNGANHPHEAQNPKVIDINTIK